MLCLVVHTGAKAVYYDMGDYAGNGLLQLPFEVMARIALSLSMSELCSLLALSCRGFGHLWAEDSGLWRILYACDFGPALFHELATSGLYDISWRHLYRCRVPVSAEARCTIGQKQLWLDGGMKPATLRGSYDADGHLCGYGVVLLHEPLLRAIEGSWGAGGPDKPLRHWAGESLVEQGEGILEQRGAVKASDFALQYRKGGRKLRLCPAYSVRSTDNSTTPIALTLRTQLRPTSRGYVAGNVRIEGGTGWTSKSGYFEPNMWSGYAGLKPKLIGMAHWSNSLGERFFGRHWAKPQGVGVLRSLADDVLIYADWDGPEPLGVIAIVTPHAPLASERVRYFDRKGNFKNVAVEPARSTPLHPTALTQEEGEARFLQFYGKGDSRAYYNDIADDHVGGWPISHWICRDDALLAGVCTGVPLGSLVTARSPAERVLFDNDDGSSNYVVAVWPSPPKKAADLVAPELLDQDVQRRPGHYGELFLECANELDGSGREESVHFEPRAFFDEYIALVRARRPVWVRSFPTFAGYLRHYAQWLLERQHQLDSLASSSATATEDEPATPHPDPMSLE